MRGVIVEMIGNGYSKSCGCLRNELSRERSKRRAAARKAALNE